VTNVIPPHPTDWRIIKASQDEEARIAAIEQRFAGNDDFILHCIVKGWTLTQAEKAFIDQPKHSEASCKSN
jgi:hypothetical protein